MNWVGMCMLAIIVLALTYACNHNNAGVDLERGLSLPVHPEVSCLQLVIFSYPSYNYPSVHVIVLRMILRSMYFLHVKQIQHQTFQLSLVLKYLLLQLVIMFGLPSLQLPERACDCVPGGTILRSV